MPLPADVAVFAPGKRRGQGGVVPTSGLEGGPDLRALAKADAVAYGKEHQPV